MGFTLSTPVDCRPEASRYVLKGAHSRETLMEMLEAFINKFVLCPACGNPETLIVIQGGQVKLSCEACTHTSAADNKHKLAAYMVKKGSASSTKSKYNIRDVTSADFAQSANDDFGDESDWAVDTSSAAVALRRDALLGEPGK